MREKIAEIFFEAFSIEKMRLISQSLLPLYGAGIETGIILHIGESSTTVSPIYQGFRAGPDVHS